MIKYFIIAIFLLPCSAFAQTRAEATFHASPARTGIYTTGNYATMGPLKWKFKTSGKIFSSPAIYNGMVYIGSGDGNLYAVGEKSGSLVWKFTTGGAVHSSPAVYNDVVYFGSFDGYYYAVNAKTGKLIWRFKTAGERLVGAKGLWTMKPKDEYMDDPFDFFLSSPVRSADNKNPLVYFGSSDGNLYALDARSGKKKWAFKTQGIIHTSPALYRGKIYFGSWDRNLYALDANTGKLLWKFETKDQPVYHLLEGIQSSPACADGMVYFGSRDGFLYALNAETGKLTWKYAASGSWVLTTPAVKDGTVYAGTSDTFLFLAFDAKTGKQKFQFKANGYVYSSPAICSNTAYFGDFTGNFFAIDTRSGRSTGVFTTPGRTQYAATVLKQGNIDFSYLVGKRDLSIYSSTVYGMNRLYTLGPIVSSPAIDSNTVFFGSADGYLYALNLK
ncbi:MAG: PQQ-binding-like beta-propeller repeat protein [Bacteroidetes bacterium]|nr:PQQ-binding-like beta-propeller repeat protein [Bacteroidota bacterium]